MRVESKGLAEIIDRMRGRSERVQHLEPALDFVAQSFVKLTDDCFANSVDWDGKPFAPLADSTIAARAGSMAGGRGGYRAKRSALRTKLKAQGKTGRQIVKSLRTARSTYKRKRDKHLSPAGITILVDTARARNSNHTDTPKPTYFLWSAVGYLAYHMTGTKRMPERNPSPFIYVGGEWAMHPKAAEQFDASVTNFILRGEPDRGAA